jgi:hypothetical protein
MRREKDSRERKKNGCDHKFNGAQNAVEALYSNNEYKKSARNCLVSIEVRDRSTMLLVVYITKAFNRQGRPTGTHSPLRPRRLAPAPLEHWPKPAIGA